MVSTADRWLAASGAGLAFNYVVINLVVTGLHSYAGEGAPPLWWQSVAGAVV